MLLTYTHRHHYDADEGEDKESEECTILPPLARRFLFPFFFYHFRFLKEIHAYEKLKSANEDHAKISIRCYLMII